MLTQSAVTLSNLLLLLPGEPGMESPRRGQRPVVQNMHKGRFSPGRQRVGLPLLEEHAARLQELSQNCVLQLEGESRAVRNLVFTGQHLSWIIFC